MNSSMSKSLELKAFFHLLECGMWNTPPDMSFSWNNVDWVCILHLSMEQGVVGLIADGISKLPTALRPPKRVFVNMVMSVKGIEDDSDRALNMAMAVQSYLSQNQVETLIIKGVGMARNYPNPRHRVVGDIDLLTDSNLDSFEKGRQLLRQIASKEEFDVDEERRHVAFDIKNQLVELHGLIGSFVNKESEEFVREWATHHLSTSPVVWHLSKADIKLPPYQFDAIYIFLHFFHHFAGAACGLRQLCDWVLFLDKHGDKVDVGVLRNDLEKMKLMRAWQIFASVAVNYLGMPKEKMLLYDRSGDKDCRKAVLAVIKANHNLAKLRKKNKNGKKMAALLQHAKSFFHLIPTYYVNLKVFPHETIYSLKNYILSRLRE